MRSILGYIHFCAGRPISMILNLQLLDGADKGDEGNRLADE
jgi:hypothetical protein